MNGTRYKACISITRQWVWGLALLIPNVSYAVEYALEPSVNLEEIYNDNIRLTSAEHNSVTGTILSPRLNFAARMETWQLGIDTRIRNSRYHGIEGLDTTDRTINLNSQYLTERDTLQLNAGRAKESILTGAFIDADTGLVKTQVIRTNDNATTAWTWSITETNEVKLDYQYSDVAYDVSNINLFDYSQRRPGITLSHRPSERTLFFLQASASRFTVPKLGAEHLGGPSLEIDNGSGFNIFPEQRNLRTRSTTNNVQAGATYAISETITGNVSAGAFKTTSDTLSETCTRSRPPYIPLVIPLVTARQGICDAVATNTITVASHGSVYNASLTKKTEALQLTAGANRSIDPSGSGAQVQNNTFTLSVQWMKTERLIFSLSGLDSKVRALENTSAVIDRHLYNIVPSVQWRSSHNSTLNLSYSYTHLSYIGVADPISSQQVSLSFNYAWDNISVSR